MNQRSNLTSAPVFARRVHEARKRAGLSQQALADRLHVSRNTVVNWESGRCLTDYKTAVALCEVLGLSLNELSIPAPEAGFEGSRSIPRDADDTASQFTTGERRLLQLYRQLTDGGRRMAEESLKALLRQEEEGLSEPPAGKEHVFRLFAEYPSAAAAGSGGEFGDTRPKPIILQSNPRNRLANAVVRVSGDSMEPVYHDGDLLYFRYANTARTGTDVVCSTIHGAIVKRMGEDGGLFSVNPQRPFRMKTEADNVRLLGVVTGIAEPGDWPSAAEADGLVRRFRSEEADFRRKYRLEGWE